MTTVFCQMCGGERRVVGDIPPVCPICGLLTIWATVIVRTKVEDLSADDREFLARCRIAIE